VSGLFRKELGDVLWDRILLLVNVDESENDDFVALECFLADRPAVTASIKVLKIAYFGSKYTRIAKLLETASTMLQLERLDIGFKAKPEELVKLVAGQGEWKFLEMAREIRVSKVLFLYIVPERSRCRLQPYQTTYQSR